MLVSAIEKNAEMTSSTASAASSAVSGRSKLERESRRRREYSRLARPASSREAASEDDLHHEPAADVREEQRDEARERPAQRFAAAPAVAPAADEQQAEDHPREAREQRLVVEPQRPAEDLLREDHAGRERQREQHEPGGEDLEEQPLEREERRQARERAGEELGAAPGRLGRSARFVAAAEQPVAVQLALEQRHQQRVQRGDREQAVRQHREQEMQAEREVARIRRHGEPREAPGEEHAYRRERQDQRLHALEAYEQALDPVDQHREPEGDRERLAEAEAQLGPREKLVVQKPGVERERHRDRRAFPASDPRRARRGRAPARAPEVRGERAVEQRGEDVQ